ncbi:hypothetical protein [Massilia sp. YMA4]|uniref:hypothetical protein n=1 Tax=Massilia sp. YMA4 TaxID=1593482 RepID=UPI000DD126DF|nr:hypothetical protein [Massilia sp. YMA4]AXA93779.1 hypothetical protein DPH57_23125 [Massilia sp. YMA4]
MLVEAFAATDALQETGARDVIALSTSACLAPASLLGRQATLAVSLRVIYLGDDEKYRYAHNDQQHDEGKDRQYAGTSGDDELARSA